MVDISQFTTGLTGTNPGDNSTILSITNTSEVSLGSPTLIRVTLLTVNGGSVQLTGNLSMYLNMTAAERGIQIIQPPQRFGKGNNGVDTTVT